MAGNDKDKGIAECYGNDDTVDAVVAGTVVENVVLDAAEYHAFSYNGGTGFKTHIVY